ncbi:MAG: carboxypeptidase-like regulatory domain-containing protein, partial [Bacteroidales bacterium]|nr:carboxypeptidase-like regulatory domain-containing protein [Bacteroidales bacterium]
MKIKVCQMWSRLATMLFVMFCLSTAAFAQKTVTGTVLDELGEPLPGVNVVVKGTTNGATTDLDGNFSIANVADKSVLVVSFIGYTTQEISVGSRSNFQIKLAEDAEMLEEVVAIGYGTAKKGSLTGSVAKVNSEKLGDRPITDVATALQGQMAGVEIRSTSG